MPLLNVLVLCRNTPPTVVSIVDCTTHMIMEGRKIQQFQRIVNEISQDRKLTDCIFFDDASTVQTAGQILCVTCPQEMCSHVGEHDLSLFFNNLSKLKLIQANPNFFVFIYLICLTYFAVACYQVLQALQYFLWCKPQNKCPIYCSGYCIQQWKKVYSEVLGPDLQTGFMQCIDCYVRSQHWRQQSKTFPLPVSQKPIELKLPSKILRMRFLESNLLSPLYCVSCPESFKVLWLIHSYNEENLLPGEVSRLSAAWLRNNSWWQGSLWIN